MRNVVSEYSAFDSQQSKEPFVVIEISFDLENTDLVYFTSHQYVEVPVGAVVFEGVVSGVASTSQRVEPDQARSTIGSISAQILDKDGDITNLFNEKDVAGKGLRGKRLRIYQGFRGMDWDATSQNLIQTQIIQTMDFVEGLTYDIKCSDIQRTVRNDIFNLAKTNLSNNVSVDQMLIPVISTADFAAIEHGDTFTDAPNLEVGYIRIEKEIIRWSSKTVDGSLGPCFVVSQRGALGSKAAVHEIDSGASSDRTTEVEEFVYLEMPAIKLAYAIYTGSLYGQPGKFLPEKWHLNIDAQYIRTSDFVNIGNDLWDADTDEGLIVRFAGEEKQDGKQFIEQQLNLLSSVFNIVYSTGELGLKRFTSILHEAPYLIELNDNNVVKYGDLEIDKKSVFNTLAIQWNYDYIQEKLTRLKIVNDNISIDKYGVASPKTLEFRGLHGSRHTTAVVEGMFDRLRDRYASPPHRMRIKCMPFLNVLEVGDIVRVRTEGFKDYFRADQTMNRSMEVQRTTVDWLTGNVNIELFGSTHAAEPIAPGNPPDGSDQGDAVLPDSFYTTHGTNITAEGAAVVTSLSGGVRHITGGTGIVGSDALWGKTIYCDGDLELDSGVTLNFTKNVVLLVKGHLQINGIFDGSARGYVGASRVAPGGDHNANAYSGNAGLAGYIGPTLGGGGLIVREKSNVSGENLSSIVTNGQVQSVPVMSIGYDGSDLTGFPNTLVGTSGGTGRGSYIAFTSFLFNEHSSTTGSAGGDSGAGMLIIARGVSFGISGKIKTNGENGDLGRTPGQDGRPIILDYDPLCAGTGAGGAPGAVVFVIDGSNNPVPNLNGVEAKYGASTIPTFPGGTRVIAPGQSIGASIYTVTDDKRNYSGYGFLNSPPDLSGFNGGSRVLFMPPISVPQEDTPDLPDTPLAMNVDVFSNTPRVQGATLTTIEVSVTPPSDTSYSYSNIYYLKDGGALTYVGSASPEIPFIVPSDGATYEIRAYPVNISGAESTGYVTDTVVVADVFAENLDVVTNFILEQPFVDGSAKLKWDAVEGAESYAINVIAGTPAVIKRTLDVGNTLRYEYSYEDAIADGGPWRDMLFEVRAKSPVRTSGAWAQRNASNPQMGAPTGVQIGTIARSLSISTQAPTATDYKGTIFKIHGVSGFNPNTTGTTLYDGPNTSVSVNNIAPGTHYIKIAHYDSFSKTGLTWSIEYSATIVDTTDIGGIPQVANASVLTTLASPQHTTVFSLHDNHLWVWNEVSDNGYLNTANGANFVAGSIAADKLAVAILSAISANLGTITAGLLKTSAGTGFRLEIEGGHSLPFWLGQNSKTAGNAKMYLDSSGNLVANGLTVQSMSGYSNISDRPSDASILNTYSAADANIMSDPNLSKHSSGETGHWGLIDGTVATITATQGENSTPGLRINATAAKDIFGAVYATAKVNEKFYVNCRVFISSDFNGNIFIGAFTYNASKTDLASYPNTANLNTLTKGSWQTFSGSFTVSNVNAQYIRPRITVGAATLGYVIFDDIYIGRVEYSATSGADWNSNVSNIPYGSITNATDIAQYGIDGSFSSWSGTYPDGWGNWSAGIDPTKETSLKLVGLYAVRFAPTGVNCGLTRTVNFGGSATPAGAIIHGSINIRLVSVTSGRPGFIIDAYTDSGLTTYKRVIVEPDSNAINVWHKLPFIVRMDQTEKIFGFRVYLIGSWTSMPSGAFTGTCIFDNLQFTVEDGSLDTINGLKKGVSIDQGGITMSSGGMIRGGKTAPGAGNGFFMGYDGGSYQLDIGDTVNEKYMRFDGTNLILGKNTRLEGQFSLLTNDICLQKEKFSLADYTIVTTANSSVTVLSNGSGFYQLTSSAVSGNQANGIYRIERTISAPTWAKKRHVRFRINFSSLPGNDIWVGTGQFGSSSSQLNGIGFIIRNTASGYEAYAFCATTGGNTMPLLAWDPDGLQAGVFYIEFTPGVDAKFYVDDVLYATITTNLPTGTQYATDIFTMRLLKVDTSVQSFSSTLTIGEWRFLQKD